MVRTHLSLMDLLGISLQIKDPSKLSLKLGNRPVERSAVPGHLLGWFIYRVPNTMNFVVRYINTDGEIVQIEAAFITLECDSDTYDELALLVGKLHLPIE